MTAKKMYQINKYGYVVILETNTTLPVRQDDKGEYIFEDEDSAAIQQFKQELVGGITLQPLDAEISTPGATFEDLVKALDASTKARLDAIVATKPQTLAQTDVKI